MSVQLQNTRKIPKKAEHELLIYIKKTNQKPVLQSNLMHFHASLRGFIILYFQGH